MKLVKMSLAAAVLLGASAFAIDNVKVSGDAKLFYGTDDASTNTNGTGIAKGDLFDQSNSYGDAALRLSVTGDLLRNVSFGATVYATSTLGLENNLVANTWTAHENDVDDQWWMGELWMAGTMGKSTVKVGRMELDTPLAFSETWSVVPNTFEGAVIINQDLPDTTMVGAWVGKSNGADAATPAPAGAERDLIMRSQAPAGATHFGTFALEGAYAAGIVNNSFKPLTAQAWFYNVLDVANAYWLQGDVACDLVKGLSIGAQYANMTPKGTGITVAGTNQDSSAYAAKVGYSMDALNVSAAYSSTDKDGGLNVANVAASGQSKLYTETWWTYGVVSAPDMKAWNVTAEYDVKDIAKVGLYYTNAQEGRTNYEMDEVALTASKSFGPLDVMLAYINTDESDNANGDMNTIQAYLTLNF
jgi:imipenem/basic amino acid-specific outer membrane pore